MIFNKLMQMINSCGFFDLQIVGQKYNDSGKLADYIENALKSSLVQLGILDGNSYDLILGDKLLYGLYTFFDVYRDDWKDASVLNFWGNKTENQIRKIISAQLSFFNNMEGSLKPFFSKFLRQYGYQQWYCEEGRKIYFSRHYYRSGDFIHGDKILCLEKEIFPVSPEDSRNYMLSFEKGDVNAQKYISYVNNNFFDVDEAFHETEIINELDTEDQNEADLQHLRNMLNFLIFQSYTANWKYLYVFSPSINIISGSFFLYLLDDLSFDENLLYQCLATKVFSNMMVSFAYSKLQ